MCPITFGTYLVVFKFDTNCPQSIGKKLDLLAVDLFCF